LPFLADRHIDLSAADIGTLQPPSSRRMLDLRDKRERGLTLRLASKRQGAIRSWCWRYRDPEGRQRRIVLGHWPLIGYEEAVRRFREARRARSAGQDPIEVRSVAQRALDGRMSVSGLIDRYEAVRSPALKSGIETVRLLRKHVAPPIGAIAVADVTGDHIRRLLTAERERMARDDATLRKRGLKPRTFTLLSRIYAACGSLFSFAVAEEAIAATPLPKLRRGGSLLPAENAKARVFSDEEIAGFWSRIDQTGMDIRTRTALKLVALTAMRPGEVLGLRRRDVDLSATFVDRRGGTDRVRGNGLVTLRDTKNGLTRFIPLSPGGRALAAEALLGVNVGRDAFLFPARTGGGKAKPMETPALARAMSRRRDLFGEEMTPHRLRAMAAFLVEKLGFGSAVARDVLGHIDGSVLRRNYSGFDGLPARLDALEAVAIEIERLSVAKPDGGKIAAAAAEVVPLKRRRS
jgi:integrase